MPVDLDTDVAGGARRRQSGASIDFGVPIYLMIGTGIAGGIVIDGKPLHGAHQPVIGHVRVRRVVR
ncbi:ROK family protein [Sphingomonas sp.]|uniref:ROK family protein n=1 Tax=Sphingomonas sp. TaxID=28214 RepID=UPI00286AB765|nr:ROK family protein [Sphingomonas sp.]